MEEWLARRPARTEAGELGTWLLAAPELGPPPVPTLHPYAREVLAAGPDLELMVARWRPGPGTPPHDHGDSLGVVRIVRGRALHRTFEVELGVLRERSATEHGPGELLVVPAGVLHAVRPIGEDLVTLHAYVGPIADMLVLDPARPSTVRVRGGAGAWLPARAEDVLGTSAAYEVRGAGPACPRSPGAPRRGP